MNDRSNGLDRGAAAPRRADLPEAGRGAPSSTLCVYCGAGLGANLRHRQAARRLGRLMAENGVRLIYGGARIGLMGMLADAVIEAGGAAMGIIPQHLDAREVGHRGITELRIVESMHERKNLMFELSDAFAILPGGFGTLDETFEMITWRQLGLHDKPILLVNLDGYWDPLLRLIDHVIAEGFAHPDSRRLYTVVNGIEGVIATMRRLPQPALPDAPTERL